MVKELIHDGRTLFACEECGLNYLDQSLAERCEAWCEEKGTCNTEIIKYSIKNEKSENRN